MIGAAVDMDHRIVVTFLIGNGFDLNLKLDTSASSLVSQYRSDLERRLALNPSGLNSGLRKLYAAISSDPNSWSDFEIQLGKFSQNVTPTEFVDAFCDFRDHLSNQILESEKRIDSFIGGDLSKVAVCSSSFDRWCDQRIYEVGLLPDERNALANALSSARPRLTSFIDFNYTAIVDFLVNRCVFLPAIASRHPLHTYGYVNHVHGSITDDRDIVVGVSEGEQIEDVNCGSDARVLNMFLKPWVNDRRGDYRDEFAKALIADSDVVVIFGMSLGASDRLWWDYLAKWLFKDETHLLLIINHISEVNPSPDELETESEAVRNHFLEMPFMPESQLASVRPRILVASSHDAFDIGLDLSSDIYMP